MSRGLWTLLALLAFSAVSAQEASVHFIASGPVSFTVTADAYAAAAACSGCNYLYPDPGPAVVLEVQRQNRHQLYTLEAFRNPWSPVSPLLLEARYTVTNARGSRVLFVTDWLPLDATPTVLFSQQALGRETRVRVEIDYRLQATGDELAGDYQSSVTYRIRESDSAVAHEVFVALPTLLSLRLVGHGGYSVRFDYRDDPAAYIQAISTGLPLAATSSELERIEIRSNHPSGYTVTIAVEAIQGAALRDRLWLGGAPAHGQSLSSSANSGFATLLTAEQFGLALDGSEPPGEYSFIVRYQALLNP